MNFRSRTLRTAALAVALASTMAGGLLVNAASADIATTPPWQEAAFKDPNAVASLKFFNAAGTEVFGGSTTAPLPFVTSSATLRAGDDHATLFAYKPIKAAAPIPGAFPGAQLTAPGTYPLASPPAGLPTGVPALAGTAGDTKLSDFLPAFPNAEASAGYQGVYELRLRTSSAAKGVGDKYAVADIVVTGNTWSVYGVAPAKVDSTTAAVVPANGTYGTGFQVTATVSGASTTPAGNVTLKEGATVIGTAVALDGSGHATFNVAATALLPGTHALSVSYPGSATYNASSSTPANIAIAGSTSSVVSTIPTKGYWGTSTKVSAKVTVSGTPNPTGTVSFFKGATLLVSKTLTATGGGSTGTVLIPGNKLAIGTSAITVKYSGAGSIVASQAAAKNIVIGKAIAKVANTLSPKTIAHTKAAKLIVKVTVTGVVPTGVIKIYDGTKLIKTVTLTAANKGAVTVTLPKLKKGTHKIHAVYGGSGTVAAATGVNATLKST